MKVIRIANASGYWGDDPDALQRQVMGGHVDYISMDFLAEVTMSIMQKQKRRNPEMGYATDFLTMLRPVLSEVVKKNICVISNAGGVNPFACAKAIAELATELQVKTKIVIVHGDGILESLDDLCAQGISFTNMENGADFTQVQGQVESANVYFGAQAVVSALHLQPNIVVCGRVTDTGITLAPMIYEFGWRYDEWDKLASGIVAGHLLECGSQVTGGNFTDWHKVQRFTPMGYPIAEVQEDGVFTITKHKQDGGLVTIDTVREQLFYEMGDPKNYISPDVVCDFTALQLKQDGADRVVVTGARGRAVTASYKVSICYRDGYKATGTIAICGDDAVNKAKKFAEIFWQRCQIPFAEKLTEYFGWNACHRSLTSATEAEEILLRLSVRSSSHEHIKKFAKLVPALILSGPAGVSIVGGAPKVQEIVSYWSALIPKTAISPCVSVWGGDKQSAVVEIVHLVEEKQTKSQAEQVAKHTSVEDEQTVHADGEHFVTLKQLCLARSGDKGDAVNIGVMARSEEIYAFLEAYLSAQRIKNHFRDFCQGEVKRYTLPNLLGFNFILEKALAGGGTKSLRVDAQGKTLAQALLRQKVGVPKQLYQQIKDKL